MVLVFTPPLKNVVLEILKKGLLTSEGSPQCNHEGVKRARANLDRQ